MCDRTRNMKRRALQCGALLCGMAFFLIHVCVWTAHYSAYENARVLLRQSTVQKRQRAAQSVPVQRLSECSNTVWAHSRFAFVTLITMDDARYKRSAQKLGVMLQRHMPEIDRVLITDPSVSNPFELRHSGWKVCHMALIDGPKAADQTNRFIQSKMYSKFNAWRLSQYEALCFLDSDIMVLGDVSDLFTHHYPQMRQRGLALGVALDHPIDTQCFSWPNMHKGSFNAGVLLFQPNRTLAERLVHSIEHVPHNDGMAEQGLLNALHPAFYELPFELSGNAISKACEPDLWAQQPPRIIHMTIAKGWMGDSEPGFYMIADECLWWGLQDYCALWELSPIYNAEMA
jgi:lipopolysaccharide biosynthesis glycosyltransferase